MMSLLSLFFSFIFVFLFMIAGMPWFIDRMKLMQIGQMVREEGPKSHGSKKGTPTMGGLMMMICLILALILNAVFLKEFYFTRDLFFLIYMTLAYGILGFIDDFQKTVRKSPYGLKAREGILLQILIALPFLWLLPNEGGFSLFFALTFLFRLLVILSITNAVNLTDGLDGLLTGLAVPVLLFYVAYGVFGGQGYITLFSLIFTGVLLGFLFYNAFPAKIFMGNSGSFAIGGTIAGLVILTGTEWLFLLLGALFVLEALSVIMQVSWFKYTRKKTGEGKRIFRMTPIHHHFELAGYHENFIVIRFWIIQILLSAFALVIIS